MRLPLLLLLATASFAQKPLVVISVDGLDHRYLRDADKLGLKVPNMRKLIREGEWVQGVIGVTSTVTWPSHTSLITGKRPDEHGILGNRRPREDGGDYYWSASLLKVRTLWHAAHDAGLKTAAITWPVTVDAQIDYNLPEAFSKRKGGWMDLATIRAKSTPGLVEKIIAFDKTFDQEWMDDHTRTVATVYFLKHEKPDLILLHLVDHDAVAHEYGPFTPEALAELERTDSYIGQIAAAAAKNATICLTADHGFERIDHMINAAVMKGSKRVVSGVFFALDEDAANAARKTEGVNRQVSRSEVARFTPYIKDYIAAFEPKEHYQFTFSLQEQQLFLPPHEKGNHGQWPLRANYRSTLVLSGPNIKGGQTPEIDMLEIAPRLASILGVKLN